MPATTGSALLALERGLKGCFKGDIDIEVDVYNRAMLAVLRVFQSRFRYSFLGVETAVVLTLVTLK